VPDRCGQGEDALQDPDYHAAGGVAAVLFQVELALKVSPTDSVIWRSGLSRCAPAREGSP
jgi:hypothetical protein